jgi:hypothetical protein
MSTCDLGFEHAEPEPPVVIEEAPDTEPIADAAVEIARIEADKEVTITKIQHRALDDELAVELAALRAENETLRAQLAPPPPEEVPVVVEPAPEPEPEPDSAPPVVEPTTDSEPTAKKRRNAWWG